jgi:hypothetical protein
MNEGTVLAIKHAETEGLKAKLRRSCCRSINWYRNGIIPQEKGVYMLGAGLGNNLGLDDPQYTVWNTAGQEACQEEPGLSRAEKAQVTRARNKARRAAIEVRKERGELLVSQRVFLVAYPKKDWETRARNLGGLPKGVDVAKTSLESKLLIVPVMEEEEAQEKGLHKERVPVKKRLYDAYGRRFWVSAETKEKIHKIFGVIQWNRPLTMKETRQFGIEFTGEE